MRIHRYGAVSLIILTLVILSGSSLLSRDLNYKLVTIQDISRYYEDRIAYQHVQFEPPELAYDETDNSVASLLIVKDKKIYLFKDGYDDPNVVETQKLMLEREQELPQDLWKNKVDDKPDYIQITDRRIELQRNETQEFVSNNYGEFYHKIRDEFIRKHVKIFKTLMINRKESQLFVERKPIERKYITGEYTKSKYSISVTAKTIDEKIYYAEDADGDGITETFTVHIGDGFNWGYQSGPNLIFIFRNKQPEITNLIGKLAHYAYYGTPEEEKIIEKTFPKTETITQMINNLYRFDRDAYQLLKDNNIELQEMETVTPKKEGGEN